MISQRWFLAALAAGSVLRPALSAAATADAPAGEMLLATYNLRYVGDKSPNA